jgi:oligosaccharide repeat unit polymerase
MWFLYLVLILLGLFYSKVFYNTYFSPVGIYSLIWNGLLFLACLPVVEYTPILFEVHLIFIGSFFPFILGDFLISSLRVFKKNKIEKEEEIYSQEEFSLIYKKAKDYPLSYFIWILFILSLIGLLWFIYDTVRVKGFIALLSPAIFRAIQIDIENNLSSYLISLSMSASLLTGIEISRKEFSLLRGLFVLFPSVVFSYITGSRFLALMSFFLFISPIFLIYSQKNFKDKKRFKSPYYRKLFIKIFIGIIIFSIFFMFVYNLRSSFQESPLRAFALVPIPDSILLLYIYVTGPFYAFSVEFKRTSSLMFGQNILTPIAKILALFKIVNLDLKELKTITTGRQYAYIPFPFNTHTYLYDWYKDFGIIGILIGPFILGFISGYFYQYTLSKNLNALIICSFILTQIFMTQTYMISSFNNTWIAFFSSIIILLIIRNNKLLFYYVIKKKEVNIY